MRPHGYPLLAFVKLRKNLQAVQLAAHCGSDKPEQTLRYHLALLDHLRVQRQVAKNLNERLMEEVRARLHSLIEKAR
jgi:hypothetical protein